MFATCFRTFVQATDRNKKVCELQNTSSIFVVKHMGHVFVKIFKECQSLSLICY